MGYWRCNCIVTDFFQYLKLCAGRATPILANFARRLSKFCGLSSAKFAADCAETPGIWIDDEALCMLLHIGERGGISLVQGSTMGEFGA
jgi:hypothetical protein